MRREVLIRIIALLQRKTLTETKNSHDYEISEKRCSVYGGRGICPLFSSPPRGIWQLKSPHPREFAIQGKKILMPGGQPGGALGTAGIDWSITR